MELSKQDEDKKTRVVRKKSVSSRALAYAILSSIGGLSKQEAKRRLGMHPTYCPERAQSFKSIQDHIEDACDKVGICIEANAATLGEVAYNRDEASSDRIRAVGEINRMAGWIAPERVEVQHQTTNILMIIQAAREQGLSVGQLIRQAKQEAVK